MASLPLGRSLLAWALLGAAAVAAHLAEGGVSDADAVPPPHLSHGAIGRRFPSPRGVSHGAGPQYLTMPVDHGQAPSTNGASWKLKYILDESHFASGGPLVVSMPGEGPLRRCHANEMMASLKALVACPEHRFFGDSVPLGNSSTRNLKYLTVEQNLADVVALIKHLRKEHPSVSKVVAYGGSYSGACASWIRRAYPDVVDAAIAQSPPLVAKMAFPEYDVSNLVALASPDSRCAQAVAASMQALERLLVSDRAALMRLFHADYHITAAMGEIDFMYGLGDSVAGAVQYGQKDMLCRAIEPVYGEQHDVSDWDYAHVFANYTLNAWGRQYYSQCFYNSTCMRDSWSSPVAESARSWYWVKCTQLGYFQTAPSSGLAARPRAVTLERLLEQCRYVFEPAQEDLITEEKVQTWNERFGGGSDLGQNHIFVTDYSDDPWKMASTISEVDRASWQLGLFGQPLLMLTCDGCGHCGAGVPAAKRSGIMQQFVAALASWGVAAPQAQAQEIQGKSAAPAESSSSLASRLEGGVGVAPASQLAATALSGCVVLALLGLAAGRWRSLALAGPAALDVEEGEEELHTRLAAVDI